MAATLDDVVAAVEAGHKLIVGSPEACRRLDIGWRQLEQLVADGFIKRIPNMRGRGNCHCYAVAELERFAATGVLSASEVAA